MLVFRDVCVIVQCDVDVVSPVRCRCDMYVVFISMELMLLV
jgi:hypothetical protein